MITDREIDMINGSLQPCPKCGETYDMSIKGEGRQAIKCPNCRHQIVVELMASLNAPGHEEHDNYAITIIDKGKIGKNKRCPCGSGRAFSKCCGSSK